MPPQSWPTAPRAYWRLNETSGTNALDWAGSYDGNYVGVITNNVPSVQSPTYLGYETTNTGYQFSGARAFVETPALGFTNNTFSIAFWAKPVNPQADGVPFMFTGGGTGGGWRQFGWWDCLCVTTTPITTLRLVAEQRSGRRLGHLELHRGGD